MQPHDPNHVDRAHATLGASSCDRWWNCPGSVPLIATVARKPSGKAAAQGTAAHELCELCLANPEKTPFDYMGHVFEIEGMEFEVDDDMAEAVTVYVDYCRELMARSGSQHWVEERVDLASLNPPVPMFGTSDFTDYDPTPCVLEVVDYKHGAGKVVQVIGNPQLRYYGLGAALKHPELRIKKVRITVVQPRAPHKDGHVRSEEIDVVDLMEWAAELIDRAHATQDPNAPQVPGSWCGFCPGAARCGALATKALTEAHAHLSVIEDDAMDGPITFPEIKSLSREQMANILEHADLIKDWLKAIYNYAHSEAENGAQYPGWKLAYKRARRKWNDEKEVEEHLDLLGLTDAQIFDKKLKSPAAIEKVLGTKNQVKIKDLYSAPVTGTTLVREDSSREAAVPLVQQHLSVIEDD